MSTPGRAKPREPSHPYLAGNFAPISKTWPPTPVTSTGEVPRELLGGMYVRNGGNPAANTDLGREAHWFDGDGMLSGVWFERSPSNPLQTVPHFVNQYILTDVYLSSIENNGLRTPILPSIATLVNPLSGFFWILWRIIRTVLVVILSRLPGSQTAIKRISVANTSILFHDGRALATCESGPPMRVTLPELETVGWFNGSIAEGEPSLDKQQSEDQAVETLGGTGPLSWMREWTTGHPKVDQTSGELVLFNCSFAPPYVQYSLIPAKDNHATAASNPQSIMNAPVPGCSGGKLMHDFGVSKHHTVILDLPLSLSPANLLKNNPVVLYEPKKPSRFGVFPRREPASVRWFETTGCCIFHTANTWDELDMHGRVAAVNLLACRMTSASVVFSAGNIMPPPHPNHGAKTKPRPMSFFAAYDEQPEIADPEKTILDERSPLLAGDEHGSGSVAPSIPISYDDEEQCCLYYYRFAMAAGTSNTITHQFALSAIPFEFPTLSPLTEMRHAQYIYGCSTTNESFGAALGKATKIDLIVKMDVKELLARAERKSPQTVTGCVDDRTVDQILASNDGHDPIKAFKLPPNHFGQEPRFVPRDSTSPAVSNSQQPEDEGYLIFYVFNEDQLDHLGQCRADSTSELWVLDAKTMDNIVCKIKLPTRVPYGLHGNWFSEEHIRRQRKVQALRVIPEVRQATRWSRIRSKLFRSLG